METDYSIITRKKESDQFFCKNYNSEFFKAGFFKDLGLYKLSIESSGYTREGSEENLFKTISKCIEMLEEILDDNKIKNELNET